MIAYGNILLTQSRISMEQLLKFNTLPIDDPQPLSPYTYDPNIEVVSTIELESRIKHISEKNKILHALAHIEYNAMKSYIDTLARFIHSVPQQYQDQFRADLGQIAIDELQHFQMADQLCSYGSQPVHNNLQKRMMLTSDSLLGRLAVLSIVNEGRGMDTGSNLVQKLSGDTQYQQVVKKIVHEESDHVKIGLKWFQLLCGDLNQQEQFLKLMKHYDLHRNWKINVQKRKQAGFSDQWIRCLQEWV